MSSTKQILVIESMAFSCRHQLHQMHQMKDDYGSSVRQWSNAKKWALDRKYLLFRAGFAVWKIADANNSHVFSYMQRHFFGNRIAILNNGMGVDSRSAKWWRGKEIGSA